MSPESMSKRFREFRENEGLTQKQLAELIGKSHVTIQSYERGTSFPNADTVWRMCEVYNTDPNDLLGWYIDHPLDRPAAARLDSEHEALLTNYDRCTPERRDILMRQAMDGAYISQERPERDVPIAREA